MAAPHREHMGKRHHRRDPLIRSLRYRLTSLATEHDPEPQLARVLELLVGAAPAYRECLWPDHDARNRRRIAAMDVPGGSYPPSVTPVFAEPLHTRARPRAAATAPSPRPAAAP